MEDQLRAMWLWNHEASPVYGCLSMVACLWLPVYGCLSMVACLWLPVYGHLSMVIATLGDPKIVFLDELMTDSVNHRHIWSFIELQEAE
ncbi:hypothetical protein BC938DRAFT_483633 [Jimgerdemannia flammicorona]|uniref:Uncharacterized protein n=1 Tax=Jimgerdemannia flammicorona TaxID=994334 RepID=A0A433QBQ6_9FUNG|nr:hypothetical protein BC938DRAFT_483633 [Jimgerdemannia flammicorona]